MNKKTIIQIVIIVAAFGAAGVVLYNGFFSNNSAALPVKEAQVVPTQNILPYGSSPLEPQFEQAIIPNRFQYNQISYPQLDPQNEVGISPDSLITSSPVTQ